MTLLHEINNRLLLAVPPMLSSFHTPIVQLNVGDRASFSCSVVKGDLPLTISWKKDGRLIDQGPHRMSATQVDQFNSMLVVDSLHSEHTGNYSCVVKNLAAEVQISQSLLVNGKDVDSNKEQEDNILINNRNMPSHQPQLLLLPHMTNQTHMNFIYYLVPMIIISKFSQIISPPPTNHSKENRSEIHAKKRFYMILLYQFSKR